MGPNSTSSTSQETKTNTTSTAEFPTPTSTTTSATTSTTTSTTASTTTSTAVYALTVEEREGETKTSKQSGGTGTPANDETLQLQLDQIALNGNGGVGDSWAANAMAEEIQQEEDMNSAQAIQEDEDMNSARKLAYGTIVGIIEISETKTSEPFETKSNQIENEKVVQQVFAIRDKVLGQPKMVGILARIDFCEMELEKVIREGETAAGQIESLVKNLKIFCNDYDKQLELGLQVTEIDRELRAITKDVSQLYRIVNGITSRVDQHDVQLESLSTQVSANQTESQDRFESLGVRLSALETSNATQSVDLKTMSLLHTEAISAQLSEFWNL